MIYYNISYKGKMRKPLLSEMTLKEKIGQCMCPTQYDLVQKTEIDELISRPWEERDEILRNTQPGVIWCMGNQNLREINLAEKNYGNHMPSSYEYSEWVKAVDKNLNVHGLMATDTEINGAGSMFSDLTFVAGGLSVGAANSVEYAYELGKCIGKELRCAGINWRWSPVVDLTSKFGISIMRPFSQDIDQMIEFTNAHIKGVQSAGVVSTAKHFPGGDRHEYRDSHLTPISISSSMEEWWNEQGKIFQKVIDGGVYSIMIQHAAFPAADDTIINGNNIVATLSNKIVTGLLKEKMGFKGVVITDAINMAGLRSFYDYDDMLVELINAGNDVLLGTRLYDGEIIEKAVNDGRISIERIDDACQRVLDMKEKIGIFEDNYFKEYNIEELTAQTKAIDKKISEASITLLRDQEKMLPFDKSKIKDVTIICSTHDDTFYDRLDNMKKSFERRGMNVKMQRRLSSEADVKKISDESDLIIYAAYIAPHRPMGAMFLFGEEAKTFQFAFFHGKEKSIGVSMGYPYIHYNYMGNSLMCINTYNDTEQIMEAFVASIFGEIPFLGKSPVDLNPPRFF